MTAMAREILILFTRFPQPGSTKTRLIPLLGAEHAARLQHEMTEHVLAKVWPLLKERGTAIEVRFDGGSRADMRQWLGNVPRFRPQGEGDLGARMNRAATDAFTAGAHAVVMIGADCPALDAPTIANAFDSLNSNRVVFGPATDGGYYLVGLRGPLPSLFEGILWGTNSVLAASLTKAREAEIEPALLPELSDVDEPDDVPLWQSAREASRRISVIIPALNEAEQLPATLKAAAAGNPFEIIVADGGSRDATPEITESHNATLLRCQAGRARQMNAGAVLARGEVLLFLHADTWLPPGYGDAVLDAFRRPDVVGGAFRFAVRDQFPNRWLIEALTNVRSRLLRFPYGDQSLFVRRWAFEKLGGFPDFQIMEDYEFVRRLRRLGRLSILSLPALTSGRRWQRYGFMRATSLNKLIILGYRCGVPPAKLAALYHRRAS
jgi:rSAM/selenodomain-associated transferase 2/rSAM/selenodomain-associated transferase 1